MNRNLPMIRKENIFTKMRNWIKRVFGRNNTIIQDTIQEIDDNVEMMKRSDFVNQIKIESKDKILALQRKLKEKQIEISALTDEELDEMIELYKTQINTKKDELKQYKNKILKKK